ncbi:MAG: hypothetical protein WDN50_17265 [Bradyrhizobium sp.]
MAFHLPQMLFCRPAHADIADCGGDQGSFRAIQRAQHDLDRKLGSIFPPRVEFDSGADLLRQRIFGRSQSVRDQPLGEAIGNDVRYLLPQQFVAMISELHFRLQIDENDFLDLVHHHHRIRRGFQQAAIFGFHLRQNAFSILAYADVADRSRNQRSFRAFKRAQHDFDRELAAILSLPGQLDAGADLLGPRVLRRTKVIRDQTLGETIRNDVRYLLPQQFVAAVSELLFRLKI